MSTRARHYSQERIVLATAIALCVVFSFCAPGFLDIGNVISLVRNVSILGLLAVAMSFVVLGRGIDLAMIATMVISSGFFIVLYNAGYSPIASVAGGLAVALVVGVVQGWLVAYAEVPPLFATLAMGVTVYGFGQSFLIAQDVSTLPQGDAVFRSLGALRIAGVPIQVFVFLAVAAAAHGALQRTKYGRFIYGLGDNPAAARLIGMPTRALMVGQYVLSAALAFLAGIVTASSVSSISLRVINSTMIYDVILVVVIGGIGLSGGKGGVRNILVGTLLIGVLLNGLTLMDVPYTMQNIIKGSILLMALMVDSFLNPRDEQTEKQGDI